MGLNLLVTSKNHKLYVSGTLAQGKGLHIPMPAPKLWVVALTPEQGLAGVLLGRWNEQIWQRPAILIQSPFIPAEYAHISHDYDGWSIHLLGKERGLMKDKVFRIVEKSHLTLDSSVESYYNGEKKRTKPRIENGIISNVPGISLELKLYQT